MTQRAVRMGGGAGLVGIVTEPEAPLDRPMVLLLNAGMLHRVGPNRLHVRLADRLASLGFRVLRFDFSGIGDSPTSDTSASFVDRSMDEARIVMDFASCKYEANRFVSIGLCSGADVSYGLARDDDRVAGAVLINGGFAEADMTAQRLAEAQERIQARFYKGRMFDKGSWKRLLTLQSDMGAVGRTLKRALRKPLEKTAEPSTPRPPAELARLQTRGVQLLRIYSEGSFTWDLLQLLYGANGEALEPFPRHRVEFLPHVDHVFTPLWAQEQLVDLVGRWATELDAAQSDRIG